VAHEAAVQAGIDRLQQAADARGLTLAEFRGQLQAALERQPGDGVMVEAAKRLLAVTA
jgi:hypothetical protein